MGYAVLVDDDGLWAGGADDEGVGGEHDRGGGGGGQVEADGGVHAGEDASVVLEVYLYEEGAGSGVEGLACAGDGAREGLAAKLTDGDLGDLAVAEADGIGLGDIGEDADGVGLSDSEERLDGVLAANGDEGAPVNGAGEHDAIEGGGDAGEGGLLGEGGQRWPGWR